MPMTVVITTPLARDSDEELIRLSDQNPGFKVERAADGTITMSPTNGDTSLCEAEAYVQLRAYAQTHGGRAYPPSAGFAIGPGHAVVAPDAAWIDDATIARARATGRGFSPISPPVVIEVTSPSDSFAETVAKVERYLERGSQYAVAIDPQTRRVEQRGTPPPGLALDFDAIIDAPT